MSIVYRIDGNDRITFVNEEWEAFALANGGEAVRAERVIGRSIWEYVSDRTTSELYRLIVKRARAGRTIYFSFRCDSPDRRRLLEMHIRSAPDASVEFRTDTLLEEARDPIPPFEAGNGASSRETPGESPQGDSGQRLRVCSWCKMVAVGTGWAEVEEAVDGLRLFDSVRVPLVTHGICERCREKMNAVIVEH